MNYADIPFLPRVVWKTDLGLSDIQTKLESWHVDYNLDINSDFQRGHVWTEGQQSAYMEWIIRGGVSGRDIYFNCIDWSNHRGQMVLVDGKQRLRAIERFLNDEIPVWGYKLSEIHGFRFGDCGFIRFHMGSLSTRSQILQWYLDFNSGGTPHKDKELDWVKKLLLNAILTEMKS